MDRRIGRLRQNFCGGRRDPGDEGIGTGWQKVGAKTSLCTGKSDGHANQWVASHAGINGGCDSRHKHGGRV